MFQWKFITTICACLLFAVLGDGNAAAKKGSAKAAVKKVVLSKLKDPYSAKFGKFTQLNEFACLGVNARNSMGGYTGEQQAFLQNLSNEWIVLSFDEISHEDCVEQMKRLLGIE